MSNLRAELTLSVGGCAKEYWHHRRDACHCPQGSALYPTFFFVLTLSRRLVSADNFQLAYRSQEQLTVQYNAHLQYLDCR